MRTRIAFCSAVLTMLSLLSVGIAHAESTYIVAGSLIDPLKGKVIRNPVVEIQGDRIIAVTSGGAVPDNAAVIDLGSATILPGLAVSTTDEAIRGVVNARKTLMAGFTVARNLGAAGYAGSGTCTWNRRYSFRDQGRCRFDRAHEPDR